MVRRLSGMGEERARSAAYHKREDQRHDRGRQEQGANARRTEHCQRDCAAECDQRKHESEHSVTPCAITGSPYQAMHHRRSRTMHDREVCLAQLFVTDSSLYNYAMSWSGASKEGVVWDRMTAVL